MSYPIKIASSQQEKEAIYRFRYKVYMEELNKLHIAADHANKMMFDEADEYTILYYVCDENDVIATVRLKRGIEDLFTEEENNLFSLSKFRSILDHKKLCITDRLIVDALFRRSRLTNEMMVRTYLGGLEGGVKLCFITSDEKLLPMYFRYGFRNYDEPIVLAPGEKRYKLILFLCDKDHLQKVKSPFLPYLPESFDDKGEFAMAVEEKLAFKLTMELQPQ
jgi:hypothetical protein